MDSGFADDFNEKNHKPMFHFILKKELIIIFGIGVPIVIFMILIGGGGHSPSIDFEEDAVIIEKPKQTESTYQVTPKPQSTQPIPQQSLVPITPQSSFSLQDCSGVARCIIGKVTQVVDGDTIKVDGQSIRFALSSAPELNEFGGDTAREFIEEICPVGSTVLVDEDDGQTQGSYGRIIGVIYCNEVNLNEELVDSGLGYLTTGFCDRSEFASNDWTIKHGCTSSDLKSGTSVSDTQGTPTQNDCDPSYPDFCIPFSPPDLDCKDISQKKFTVLSPDSHRFDGDKDGIGCES